MSSINLLYHEYIDINDKIKVMIPTVGEILAHENEYFTLFSTLTAMPIDFMLQLDEMGIDFSKINDYELFLHLFPYIQSCDTSLIFGDLDLSKFQLAVNEETGKPVLVDPIHDIVIDRMTQSKIAATLRLIHGTKKDIRKPANVEAKDYMLSVAKRRAKRRKGKKEKSHIETLIVAMVNSPEFKYDFTTVKDLSIYQFNESVRQILKRVDYNYRMIGVYAGTIKASDIPKDDLNWLVH